MHIAAAQPAQLAAAQPRPGHQQHDQPVPRRQARPQQRGDLGVTGPVHRPSVLAQPVPGPQPARHPAVLPAGLGGKIPVISNLIQQRHQMRRRLPGRHRVCHHAAHRRQHRVHPPGTTNWRRPRSREHLTRAAVQPGSLRAGVPQPRHEQPQMLDPGMPGPARPGAPPQEQHDPARIRPRGQLRAVPPEPDVTQERVRIRNHAQLVVEHRPVPLPGRHRHRERPHPNPPFSCRTAITTTSNKNNTGTDVSQNNRVSPLRNVTQHLEHPYRTRNK